jgi:hypothetical protein
MKARPKMKFNRRGYRDDLLFVIALLVPAIFAGARYLESDRQMTEIAQAQVKRQSVATASSEHGRAPVRVAETERRDH